MNYVIIPKEDYLKIETGLKVAQETLASSAEMLQNINDLLAILREVSK